MAHSQAEVENLALGPIILCIAAPGHFCVRNKMSNNYNSTTTGV
jgi:hypothetical protein